MPFNFSCISLTDKGVDFINSKMPEAIASNSSFEMTRSFSLKQLSQMPQGLLVVALK
jgi:hypothetical protein